MTHDLNTSDYDCDMVNFSLYIPLAVQIREKATILYLLKELNAFHDTYDYDIKKIHGIKDIWKWFSPFFIEGSSSKQINTSCDEPTIMIDAQIIYSSDEVECKKL